MSEIDARIDEVRRVIEEKNRQRVRAEAELDAAVASRDRVLEELRSEFGVGSLDEAQELSARLQKELEQELESVRRQLGGDT